MLTTIWDWIQDRFSNTQLARFGLSLLIAIFLWGWVTLLQDPVETQRYAEMSITAPDLPGTTQIVTSLPRASVSITDVSSKLDELSRSDIAVTLDTAEIDGPGSYQLKVVAETTEPVREIRVSPDTVSVQIEEEVSENFPLAVETQMPADDTRRVLEVNPDVSEVTVTGTESNVNRVRRVILPVSIRDQTGDFTENYEPRAVDADNQRVQEVTIVPGHVRTQVNLDTRGRTVSVVPQITGVPDDGYVVQQQVAIPATVIVDGPQEVLEKLLFVNTEPVDVSGATEPVSATVGLVDLPDGVTLVDPPVNQVEVRVSVVTTGNNANLITDMPIEIGGVGDGLTASVEPVSVDIRISAPSDTLTSLSAEDFAVSVDASGLGAGVYTLTPSVDVPEGVVIASVEPEEVVVLISDGSATPAAASSPAAFASDD